MHKSSLLIVLLSLFFLTGINTTVHSQSLLWKVSGSDLSEQSYIYATLPIQDSNYFKVPDKFWRYVNQTDVLIKQGNSSNSSLAELTNKTLGELPRTTSYEFEDYLISYVKQQAMPVVELGRNQILANVATDYLDDIESQSNSLGNVPSNLDDLILAYQSGMLDELVRIRTKLDVPPALYQEFENKQHYLILNELLQQMKLQPSIIAIDALHLGGPSGLLGLLKARGYNVKPMESKFYARQGEQLMAQRAYLAQLEAARQPVIVDPKMNEGISLEGERPREINTQPAIEETAWVKVYTADSLVSFSFPASPNASIEEGVEEYSASHKGLDFVVRLTPLSGGENNADLTRLVISTGGQVVQSGKVQKNNIPGNSAELMYSVNRLSKHFLAAVAGKNLSLSVTGDSPHIFTAVVDEFLGSVQSHGALPVLVDSGGLPVASDVWTPFRAKNLYASLPAIPKERNETLDNGNDIELYLLERPDDGNNYVISVNKREAFDNFQLYNTSINAALAEANAIIVDQSVMPEGKTTFASYLIKDALDNYYRIIYQYDGEYFYQFVVKGSKKSVQSSEANQIVSSLFLTLAN